MQVERISLSNPVFDMEGDNTVYLLVDGDTVGLVDVGVATERTRADLEAGLSEHGHVLSAVDHVFLTHWHPDHAGLAGQVQAESGATVHAHEADAPLVAGDDGAVAELATGRERSLAEWGLPESVREEIGSRLGSDRGPRGYGERPTVTDFRDGATLPFGDASLDALHAPGHTAGETCYLFEHEGRREVFTGDALLPDYTPNVGGADLRTEHPLTEHLRTLRRLADASFDRGLPGHGEVMSDPAVRARTVLEHHRDRAETLLAAMDDEPTTVWEATGALFGDLAEVHLMLGLGETHAHLEYLRGVGAVERAGDAYRTVPDPDLAAAFPEVAQ